jgi:NAD(P)-dependent dehydrogenase (short-subunit alcohol dehydrogenase family)
MIITNLFSLEDKTAIVTGALGLLGRQHCYALSEAGAFVVAADLDEEGCQEFVLSLPTRAMGVYLDVTNPQTVIRMRERVLERFKRVDVLVNNAAVNDMFESPRAALKQSNFENYPLELWKKSLDVNLTGVFLCSRVIGVGMAEQKSGSIINIASTYGVTAPDQSLYQDQKGRQVFYKPPAYPATKGAVLAFTRYLAAYWGHLGVRVNALSPGGVKNCQDEFFQESYSRRTPLGRMAAPTDYKGAIVFLASDASAYMTGANLIVDGGWTTW